MKYLFYLLSILLLCSCRSSRSMQKEINGMRSDLFYELTSSEYSGKKKDTVYLDFIDYSNIDYYTTIKKKGGFAVPLFIFNFEKNKFRTHLGEHSLSQLYREFLTDALLTECNSSTCFHLADNKDNRVPADSVYRLEVKIRQNKTVGGVVLKESSFIWFEGDYVSLPNYRYQPAETELSIVIRLSFRENCLLDKTYHTRYKHPRKSRRYCYSYEANQACLDNMAECLSYATKEIVEDISQELHLLLSGKQQHILLTTKQQ